jgi:hypothetical protein
MLPTQLFENRTISQQITDEAKVSSDELFGWKINDVKWSNRGIEVVIDGANFISRGYAEQEAIFANNIVKRLIIKGLPLLNMFRSTEVIIENFTDIAWKVMSPYILKYDYLSPFSKELHNLTLNFINAMGIEGKVASRFTKIIAHLFEYDNAYRLRLEDLFNETNPEELTKNTRKEIARLLEINRVREVRHKDNVSSKFKLVANLIGLVIYLPKINKAFKKALLECDYKKLCVDNIELYWMCHRTDYDFLGKTYEDRVTMLEQSGYKIVKGQKYNV